MSKQITEWMECDVNLAAAFMEQNKPVKACHPAYPKGIKPLWINESNGEVFCSIVGSASKMTFYDEDITLSVPIYRGQKTAF